VAALDRLWNEFWRPQLDAQFSPTLEPLKRIIGYLESMYQLQSERKNKTGRVLGCPVCSVGSEIASNDENISAKVREICGRKRCYFETAIRDAVAAGAIEPCDPAEKVNGLIGL